MGLGVYKCWSMGLLPTESSDWLAWREPRVVSIDGLFAYKNHTEVKRFRISALRIFTSVSLGRRSKE